jgi:hypothetical protein
MKMSKAVALPKVLGLGGYDGLQGFPAHAGPTMLAVPVIVLAMSAVVVYE